MESIYFFNYRGSLSYDQIQQVNHVMRGWKRTWEIDQGCKIGECLRCEREQRMSDLESAVLYKLYQLGLTPYYEI